jgi:hypothetical protein
VKKSGTPGFGFDIRVGTGESDAWAAKKEKQKNAGHDY